MDDLTDVRHWIDDAQRAVDDAREQLRLSIEATIVPDGCSPLAVVLHRLTITSIELHTAAQTLKTTPPSATVATAVAGDLEPPVSPPRHKSEEELRALLAQCPRIGPDPWLHVKSGRRYLVLGRFILEKTDEPAVLYASAADGVRFGRPLSEWAERFVEGRLLSSKPNLEEPRGE